MGQKYWYKKDGGEFILMKWADEVYRCKSIAIVYSGQKTGDFKLEKHGRPDLVQTWFSQKGNEFREAGHPMDFADFVLIETELFEADDLTKLVGEPEFIKEYISKMNSDLLSGIKKEKSGN